MQGWLGRAPATPRLLWGLAALTVAALAMAALGTGGSATGAAEEAGRGAAPGSVDATLDPPNLIFIYTDDQTLASFDREYMPRTFRLLVDPGTWFEDYVVSTPLCCPSRVSYLTGSYPHNSGVFVNRTGYSKLRGKADTLPVWLRRAGYRTAWVGKFLQGYQTAVADPLKPPPGFDDWHATFEPRYYGYEMAVNGRRVRYGSRPRDYFTDVITGIATRLIRRQAGRARPLYLTVNNLAPHRGGGGNGPCRGRAMPAPREARALPAERMPQGRSFNWRSPYGTEQVDSPRIPREQIAEMQFSYRCRIAALRAVDRGVAAIYRAVERAGELSNTVFVISSDNGILLGEHRLLGKNVAYEEAIHQPLAILAGSEALGAPAVVRVDRLAANVDLAPTLLELAGASPCREDQRCRPLDGRSLVPLLRGEDSTFPADREILIEGGDGRRQCSYAGIRTPQLTYVEYSKKRPSGRCEARRRAALYDLSGALTGKPDPLQLNDLAVAANPAARSPAVLLAREQLRRRLAELERCEGAGCR